MDRVTNKKFLTTVAYVAFGFAALLMSFYLTFPAEAVGQRIAHEVQRNSKGKVSFSFGDASLYRFTGVSLSNVKVTVLQDGKEPLLLDFDKVAARIKILPLLLLRTAVHATLELGDGMVSIDFSKRGEVLDADFDIDDLDFTQPPLLPKLAGISLAGKLNASGKVYLAEQPNASTGNIEIDLKGGSVGPGAIAGFTVPQLGLGNLKATFDLKDGKAKVTKFENSGGNLTLGFGGEMALRPKFDTSTLDLCAQLKADPEWLAKNDKVRSALQLAEIQFTKDPSGTINIPLRGSVQKPQPGKGLCKK